VWRSPGTKTARPGAAWGTATHQNESACGGERAQLSFVNSACRTGRTCAGLPQCTRSTRTVRFPGTATGRCAPPRQGSHIFWQPPPPSPPSARQVPSAGWAPLASGGRVTGLGGDWSGQPTRPRKGGGRRREARCTGAPRARPKTVTCARAALLDSRGSTGRSARRAPTAAAVIHASAALSQSLSPSAGRCGHFAGQLAATPTARVARDVH
jgi:hypothetical protein